jgi:hypothetical protein
MRATMFVVWRIDRSSFCSSSTSYIYFLTYIYTQYIYAVTSVVSTDELFDFFLTFGLIIIIYSSLFKRDR